MAARSGDHRSGKPVIKSPSPAGGKRAMTPAGPRVSPAMASLQLSAALKGKLGPKSKRQALLIKNIADKGK